jgi:membrane associated rhomboid family serine protease
MMARLGSTSFSFPEFGGATRRLVLWNLCAFFALLLAGWAFHPQGIDSLGFDPRAFLQGALWQPLTYSLVHTRLLGTLFELLSLWFLAGFLETYHNSTWVTGLYITSVLGTAAAALAIYSVAHGLGFAISGVLLTGCFGGIFGLLVAIGILYGDVQFMLFPLPIGIKARYLVAIYALVTIAMLFSDQQMYAFSQLGGALAGVIFIRLAPRRGVSFAVSESWYAIRNRFYRWKRRRAARKFEVYMRSQGRTVRFDSKGRQIDEDADDKKRWN